MACADASASTAWCRCASALAWVRRGCSRRSSESRLRHPRVKRGLRGASRLPQHRSQVGNQPMLGRVIGAWLCLGVSLGAVAHAAEIEGLKIDDRVYIAQGLPELTLN